MKTIFKIWAPVGWAPVNCILKNIDYSGQLITPWQKAEGVLP